VRAHIFVRTLGSVAIHVGKRQLGPSSGRIFALLLYLASRRGHPCSRQVAQELLFPSVSDGQAAHSLRQLLYRLRQLGAPVVADSDQLSIRLEDVSVDWWDILSTDHLGTSDFELVSQGLFPGYHPTLSEAFREWFEAECAEICLRITRHIAAQLGPLRGSARWELVEVAARALLALDPLSEEGTLARAEALAIAGSKSAALGVIDAYMEEIGEVQPRLRLSPSALRRRISERLPDNSLRATGDERLFVGREETMRLLNAMDSDARRGEQRVLLLWGEPGVGKTRLLKEFSAVATLRGTLVVMLSCQSHDMHRPLGVICDLVPELLNLPGSLGCDPEARVLLEELVTLRRHIDIERRTPRSEITHSAIVRSLGDLLSAISAEFPISIILDDAQWIDEESLNTFAGIFGRNHTRRANLVLASRERSLVGGRNGLCDNVASIRLNPLRPDAASELVNELLRALPPDSVEAIQNSIVQQARGNPYFIRVLCCSVRASGSTHLLKRTLQEALTCRIDQLSTDSVRVLESCVVLGKSCSFRRLESLLQLPRPQLLRSIEELDDRGLVEIYEGGYVSSHALLSEVVIGRMSQSVARALHAAVAELLESEFQTAQGSSALWDCAEHWRMAGNEHRALALLRDYAERLIEVGRPTDALATAERALTLDASNAERLALVDCALEALWLSMNFQRAAELLGERRRLLLDLDLPLRSHDIPELLELVLSRRDEPNARDHITKLRRCLTAPEANDLHRLNAARQLMMIAELRLEPELAHTAWGSISRLASGTRSRLATELLYHTCFGDPGVALTTVKDLLAEPRFQLSAQPGLLLNVAYALYRVGSPEEAETSARNLAQLGEETGDLPLRARAHLLLARLFSSTGRLVECEASYGDAQSLFGDGVPLDLVNEHCVLGARLALRDGRAELARVYVERGLRDRHAAFELPRLLIRCCAVELRIAVGEVPCTADELTELISLHKRARGMGCQDEVMLAVVHALEAAGRADEGEQLLQEYVDEYRRDGFPLNGELLVRSQEHRCSDQGEKFRRVDPIRPPVRTARH
jgi:tetratricopeptide (TPR) repeat protein